MTDRLAEGDAVKRNWTEPLGVHDLDRTLATAERLAATYECTTPAYGAPTFDHCAACCYGTGIAATSMDEFETAQVLLAVPSLIAEIRRLRGSGAGPLSDGPAHSDPAESRALDLLRDAQLRPESTDA